MAKDENGVFEHALKLLQTDDVRRAARERRERFQTARRWTETGKTEESLQEVFETAARVIVPRLLQLRDPPLIPNTGFVIQNLSRSWIRCFLREAASTETDLRTLARKYAKALVAEVDRDTFRVRSVIPLVNFVADREFKLSLHGGTIQSQLRIVRNPYPNAPWLLGFHPFWTERDLFNALVFDDSVPWSEWAGVIDSSVCNDADSYKTLGETEQAHEIRAAILTAFRLFQDGDIDMPVALVSRDLLIHAGARCHSAARERVVGANRYALSESGIRDFRRFWNWFRQFSPLGQRVPPRIALAIEFFETSNCKYQPASFLDLAIALEALFGIAFETTYRLAIRVAAFLERKKPDALKTYAAVKGLWSKYRNTIAHGSVEMRTQKLRTQVASGTSELRILVRRSIIEHLELFEAEGMDVNAYETVMKDFEERFVIGRGLR